MAAGGGAIAAGGAHIGVSTRALLIALPRPPYTTAMALLSGLNKIFVLDTNVILHDHACISSFQEHNVVIPITVLEEIDKFKKGNEIINFNAREFSRKLDAMGGDKLLSDGIPLPSGGTLVVETNVKRDGLLGEVFWEDKPDHRIISLAFNMAKEYGKDRVILVSKDINVRMKAKSIGIKAEDYETGKISNIDELYKGKDILQDVDGGVIDELFQEGSIAREKMPMTREPFPNEYFIIRNQSKSTLAVYNAEEKSFHHIQKRRAYGIEPRNAEQTFSLDALFNESIPLVTLAGKAGTGKTLMALAAALEKRSSYKQIYLARPIVPLSNRDIGFLPGDIKSKLDPFMQPLFDNLTLIQNQFDETAPEFKRIHDLVENGKLVITPLAYIRGRHLSKIYFIIDEAQNLTPHEVKTIITRAGEGTKVVFTGDPYQIDTPYLDSRSNGLTCLIDRMKGESLYAHVTLEKGERSKLAELASNIL
jgi:PhoH-like ATPase